MDADNLTKGIREDGTVEGYIVETHAMQADLVFLNLDHGYLGIVGDGGPVNYEIRIPLSVLLLITEACNLAASGTEHGGVMSTDAERLIHAIKTGVYPITTKQARSALRVICEELGITHADVRRLAPLTSTAFFPSDPEGNGYQIRVAKACATLLAASGIEEER